MARGPRGVIQLRDLEYMYSTDTRPRPRTRRGAGARSKRAFVERLLTNHRPRARAWPSTRPCSKGGLDFVCGPFLGLSSIVSCDA